MGRATDILRAMWTFDTQPTSTVIDAGAYKSGVAESAALQPPSIFVPNGVNETRPQPEHAQDPTSSVFEDELMSMWMAVPPDVACVRYIVCIPPR